MLKNNTKTCLTITLLYLLCNACKPNVFVSNIKEADCLKETISILFSIENNQLLICDIKNKTNFDVRLVKMDTDNRCSVPIAFAFGDIPNNDLFICTEDSIWGFKDNGSIFLNHSLPDFNIDPKKQFGGHMKIKNGKIYLSVEDSQSNDVGVLEWDIKSPASKSKYKKYDLMQEIDPFDRVILNFENKGGLYTADPNAHFTNMPPSDNFVLSAGYDSCIYVAGKNLKNPTVIARGQEAQWGSDNNIYYTKGSSELWRYRPEIKKEQLIFSSGLKQCKNEKVISCQLEFSADRNVLGYIYINPAPDNMVNSIEAYRCGMFILDIENNEFIDLSPEWFYNLYLRLDNEKSIKLNSKIHSYLLQKKHFLHIGRFKIKGENRDSHP